jgi:CheY-like chemotaxis protein
VDAKDFLHFQVDDTGVGISAADLERIFLPFTQVDASMSREFGGTGLGLSISRHLSEMLSGQLWATSQVDVGSTFHARIPLHRGSVRLMDAPPPLAAVEPVPAAISGTSAVTTPKRVLVVEDNAINRRLVQVLLDRLGYTVILANDGEQACQLDLQDIDLVLMDLEMPKMGGLEATEIIRAKGFVKPIIAVTAHALDGYREMCAQAGMDDFITKPLSRAILTSALERHLDR